MKKKKQTKRFESTEIKQSAFVNEDYKMMKTFLVVLLVVLLFVGLLYIFNGRMITKDVLPEEETTTTAPTYDDTIILGDNIFDIKDKEYMVLLFDTGDDTNNFLYASLASYYTGDVPLYTVDLANKMNGDHFNSNQNDGVNKNPTKASEVVVSGPTLLTIKNKKVTSYLEKTEEIRDKLSTK